VGPHPGQKTQDHAAVLPLHLQEAGHGRLQAQALGVAPVDSTHQGLRHALQGLTTHPASNEAGQGLVSRVPTSRQDQVQADAQLAQGAQNRRQEERNQARGSQQAKTFRNRHQAAVPNHHGPTIILVGGLDQVFQAQIATQLQARRLVGDHGVRSALQDQRVLTPAFDGPPGARASLEEVNPQTRVFTKRGPGQGQPADPGPHDGQTAAHPAVIS